MYITGFESSKEIRKELGSQIQKYRIESSKTQQDISDLSGVSLSTIKLLEKGEGCSLDNFIRILQVLNIAPNFNNLIPKVQASPYDVAKLGKERRRVSKKGVDNVDSFVWGEDK